MRTTVRVPRTAKGGRAFNRDYTSNMMPVTICDTHNRQACPSRLSFRPNAFRINCHLGGSTCESCFLCFLSPASFFPVGLKRHTHSHVFFLQEANVSFSNGIITRTSNSIAHHHLQLFFFSGEAHHALKGVSTHNTKYFVTHHHQLPQRHHHHLQLRLLFWRSAPCAKRSKYA